MRRWGNIGRRVIVAWRACAAAWRALRCGCGRVFAGGWRRWIAICCICGGCRVNAASVRLRTLHCRIKETPPKRGWKAILLGVACVVHRPCRTYHIVCGIAIYFRRRVVIDRHTCNIDSWCCLLRMMGHPWPWVIRSPIPRRRRQPMLPCAPCVFSSIPA